MTKLRATSIALFLAVAALALGACGGDDEGSTESATTGTDATTTGTGTTDTTTGATDTGTTERTGKTNTQERKRDDKGGSSRRGSDDSSGSGGKGNSGSSPETQLTRKNVYSTAKTVCSQFLPHAVARDLENGKTSAEEVSKDYAGVYPSDQRKRAYDGCLAGLKTRE